MRTNDIKKLVQTQLETLTENVYHEIANEKAVYPHIVFALRRIDLMDLSRQDYVLEINVWDRSKKTTNVDNLADLVEDLFQAENLPQDDILPTFYLMDRNTIEDEDKQIRHRQVRFQIQNYER